MSIGDLWTTIEPGPQICYRPSPRPAVVADALSVMRSCAVPTALAMLLLLSCSATPGLASVRRDQTDDPPDRSCICARLEPPGSRRDRIGRGAHQIADQPAAAAAKTHHRDPPRHFAASGAATAGTKGSRAPSPFGTILPRSDRAISLGWPGTRIPGAKPGPRARYRPPLAGLLSVLHRFEQPATLYAAGHRGVDLAATSGQPVLAARGGRVQFAGPVAGRGVVVIAHSDGIRTEYEPVAPQCAPETRSTPAS